MKVRELVRLLERDGWFLAGICGSHRQYKHPEKPGRVTVSGKLGADVPVGTLKAVMKQAGLNEGPK